MLDDFMLPSRSNQHWKYSGIDSLYQCRDKKHFKLYPHEISYNYNSRGFRDSEWPDSLEKLKQSIWCVGDSFTVGIGSPLEHTWVHQVGQQLNKSTINISLDGASNHWIARKTLDIIKQISPELIIIQWSYLHRSESSNGTQSDEHRRMLHDPVDLLDDYALISKLIKFVEQIESVKENTKIIHSFIPNFGVDMESVWNQIRDSSWPEFPKTIREFNLLDTRIINEIDNNFKMKELFEISYKLYQSIEHYIKPIVVLDIARDGHHYDILTAQQFAVDISKLLNRIS